MVLSDPKYFIDDLSYIVHLGLYSSQEAFVCNQECLIGRLIVEMIIVNSALVYTAENRRTMVELEFFFKTPSGLSVFFVFP